MGRYRVLSISTRVSNNPDDLALLMSAHIENRWVTDAIDTSNASSDVVGHKAFIKCVPKKIGEGKIEPGAGQAGLEVMNRSTFI